jgi:hypothetical protein
MAVWQEALTGTGFHATLQLIDFLLTMKMFCVLFFG